MACQAPNDLLDLISSHWCFPSPLTHSAPATVASWLSLNTPGPLSSWKGLEVALLGMLFPQTPAVFTLHSACRSFSKVTYIDRSSLSIPTDNVSTSLCLILPYHLSSFSFISSQCSLVPNIIYISTLYLVILLSYHPNASEEQGFLSVLCCVLESGIVPAYLKDQ